MSVEKKSLISSRTAAKKAVIARSTGDNIAAADGKSAPTAHTPVLSPVKRLVSPKKATFAPKKPTISPMKTTFAAKKPTISPMKTTFAAKKPTISPMKTTFAAKKPAISPMKVL